MIFAGLAFAGTGRLINEIFPSNKASEMAEESKRHNKAMEEYTRAKEAYQKQLTELNNQRIERDRNQ